MRYPVDSWPAVALGLLLLGESLTVPSLKPRHYQKRMRAALREVQGLGWPMRHSKGSYALPADIRRAALRDGAIDWAGAVLQGLVVRREGPAVELGRGVADARA